MKLLDASNVLHSNKYLWLMPAVVSKIDHLQGVLMFDIGRSGYISYISTPMTSLKKKQHFEPHVLTLCSVGHIIICVLPGHDRWMHVTDCLSEFVFASVQPIPSDRPASLAATAQTRQLYTVYLKKMLLLVEITEGRWDKRTCKMTGMQEQQVKCWPWTPRRLFFFRRINAVLPVLLLLYGWYLILFEIDVLLPLLSNCGRVLQNQL